LTGVVLLALLAANGEWALAVLPDESKADPPNLDGLRTGRLLVANDNINTFPFAKSVVLLTNYGPEGAVGVIINRPTRMSLYKVMPDIKSLQGKKDLLFFGGPVSGNVITFLMQSEENLASYDGVSRVFGDLYFLMNKKVIHHHLGGKYKLARGFAGYAGWGPGQLEGEMARGDWTVRNADTATIFSQSPEKLWDKLRKDPRDGVWTFFHAPVEAGPEPKIATL